jgi:hypothetical protein
VLDKDVDLNPAIGDVSVELENLKNEAIDLLKKAEGLITANVCLSTDS